MRHQRLRGRLVSRLSTADAICNSASERLARCVKPTLPAYSYLASVTSSSSSSSSSHYLASSSSGSAKLDRLSIIGNRLKLLIIAASVINQRATAVGDADRLGVSVSLYITFIIMTYNVFGGTLSLTQSIFHYHRYSQSDPLVTRRIISQKYLVNLSTWV